MTATAADLRSLAANLARIYPHYSKELQERSTRLRDFLIAEAELLDRDGLVFRAVSDSSFEVGYARSPVTLTPGHGLRALQAARAAFATPWQGIDLAPFVDASGAPSCAAAGSAIRNALRQRVVPWLKLHVDCPELMTAMRSIQISNEGFAMFQPPVGGTPKILT